ncbi:MAG: ABC transporter [Desulfuromonadales bacterium GWD2_61_12]|nr:MAG: ABC transporter [Desulfuromonadales bacterium GWD2_61_12]HBT82730.1 ABC transporter [Desulfuromonas sp.]
MIVATSLRKAFGKLRAVDDITFSVSPGECFGILGPNGAGKTTTIRMLFGFTPKSAGRLQLFGLDIDQHLRQVKARIGVCPQENNLDPDLSVRQNLEMYARYFDIPPPLARRRADQLLSFIALEHRQNARIGELSGGMLRRLVLARALINEPELLILDEPTTGLDPQSRHQLWNRVEALKARGLTVLLTTHYMDEAARLCDRLMIVDQGKILVEGTPLQLIHDHVGAEIIEVASPNADLRAFVDRSGTPYEDLGHRLIIYASGGAEYYHTLSREFCQSACMLRPATLEDVFLRLTGRELRE